MMKRLILGAYFGAAMAGQALAQAYPEYPAPALGYPFRQSFPTGRVVVIPPYEQPFPVRVYTTPPTQPYYNVPPYPVIAPY